MSNLVKLVKLVKLLPNMFLYKRKFKDYLGKLPDSKIKRLYNVYKKNPDEEDAIKRIQDMCASYAKEKEKARLRKAAKKKTKNEPIKTTAPVTPPDNTQYGKIRAAALKVQQDKQREIDTQRRIEKEQRRRQIMEQEREKRRAEQEEEQRRRIARQRAQEQEEKRRAEIERETQKLLEEEEQERITHQRIQEQEEQRRRIARQRAQEQERQRIMEEERQNTEEEDREIKALSAAMDRVKVVLREPDNEPSSSEEEICPDVEEYKKSLQVQQEHHERATRYVDPVYTDTTTGRYCVKFGFTYDQIRELYGELKLLINGVYGDELRRRGEYREMTRCVSRELENAYGDKVMLRTKDFNLPFDTFKNRVYNTSYIRRLKRLTHQRALPYKF